MIDDIRPPRPPVNSSPTPEAPPIIPAQEPQVEQSLPPEQPGPDKKPSRWWSKWLLRVLLAIGLIGLLALVAGYVWYQAALSPVSPSDTKKVVVKIEEGTTSKQIGQLLKSKGLIRDERAFTIYIRLQGPQTRLQAGTYRLSPAESTPQIVDHVTSGKVDEITITFYPGATLRDKTDKPEAKKVDVTTVLRRAGYSQQEIDLALKKKYTHPVFATKPASADLEGYVYGETYNFPASATVEEILTRTFDELYEQIKQYNLEARYKQRKLTLYEGITLASIIQREVAGGGDQKQVAQVFYKRLAEDMPLGADTTFIYAAAKLGVAPTVDIQSPYNTRIHSGLPPGPIAAPGLSALRAVADPAAGDYLYFVSGDDGTNYFSRTLEEHEANIKKYCHANCSLF